MKIQKKRPTVVFDFDGVIHSYKSGWKGDAVVADPPTEGINFAIYDLQKDFEIVIVSSRCRSEEGRNAIIKWCNQNGIYFDKVMAEKPPAVCYIDDRAICFDGNSSSLPEKVRNFKSWCETDE